MSKIFKINENNDISQEVIDKLKKISNNRLFIAEEQLKDYLTENEIIELLNQNILDDKTLE